MDNEDNENKYSADLQRARHADAEQQQEEQEDDEQQEEQENTDSSNDEAGEKSKKYKISGLQGALMISVALIIDGVEALLDIFVLTAPLNWVVWIYALLGFYIWLKVLGISWTDAKGKRTLTMFGAATGIEFIPIVNMLPAWTAFALGAVINDRIEGVVKSSPLAQKTVGMLQKKDEEQKQKTE